MYERKIASQRTGSIQVFDPLGPAIADAWLVIEAVPEKIQLKISTFAMLEKLAPTDAILATNSSSYKSSEMIGEVTASTKRRILNIHYYMPPKNMVVELMTDGFTEAAIFPFLVERLKETGASPYVARKESTGFIFNRLWAAVKRETLTILSEGVSVPEEIDSMWTEMFIKGKSLPCETMDQVGLDTVAFIEQHYIDERGLPSSHTVDYLKSSYIDHGKLGNKCEAGGLYPHKRKGTHVNGSAVNGSAPSEPLKSDPTLIVLDVGLSAEDPSNFDTGAVLKFSTSGQDVRTLVPAQSLPDGIDIDHASNRMFWTCMGVPNKLDGAIYSADIDGSDVLTIVKPGTINTPKQLCLDTAASKVYFCDREGCAVYRCNYDGSHLECLVQNHAAPIGDGVMNWCVGITVSPARGKFYWTQKGPSKGGKGRMFCANIDMRNGQDAASRTDIQRLLGGLPEPIDLEINEESGVLYSTDRGELPWGNSLNSVELGKDGLVVAEKKIISRHFNEAIGLKLDVQNKRIFVTDLGGCIYQCDLDGRNKKVIYEDETRAFTGIALV